MSLKILKNNLQLLILNHYYYFTIDHDTANKAASESNTVTNWIEVSQSHTGWELLQIVNIISLKYNHSRFLNESFLRDCVH